MKLMLPYFISDERSFYCEIHSQCVWIVLSAFKCSKRSFGAQWHPLWEHHVCDDLNWRGGGGRQGTWDRLHKQLTVVSIEWGRSGEKEKFWCECPQEREQMKREGGERMKRNNLWADVPTISNGYLTSYKSPLVDFRLFLVFLSGNWKSPSAIRSPRAHQYNEQDMICSVMISFSDCRSMMVNQWEKERERGYSEDNRYKGRKWGWKRWKGRGACNPVFSNSLSAFFLSSLVFLLGAWTSIISASSSLNSPFSG